MIKLTEEFHYEIMDGISVSKENEKYYLYSTKTKDGMEITKETYESLTNDFSKTFDEPKPRLSLDDIKLKLLEWKYEELFYTDYEGCFDEFKGKIDSILYFSETTFKEFEKDMEKIGITFLEEKLNKIIDDYENK